MSDPFDDDLEQNSDADSGATNFSTDETAEVHCPWCGEVNEVALDVGSGEEQIYVEDCQVCCRPWRVHVTYDRDGKADVRVEAEGE
jgi:hypothetical protein